MKSRFPYVIIILIVLLFLTYLLSEKMASWTDKKSEESATVMVDRIKKVFKVATVEGQFSEVYSYKDYWGYDWSPFRKKALLRVKAKVSVGYDLESLVIDVDHDAKHISVKNLPNPRILSIDHDLDYYDITEGTFNSFTEKDYNVLQKNAKSFVEERVADSDLYMKAGEQAKDIFDFLSTFVKNAGWTISIEEVEIVPELTQKSK